MIKIFNPDKLTRQPFFQELVNYLHTHEDVTLRQIKRDFAKEMQLDKLMEKYITAGYIVRENRRYRNGFDLLLMTDQLTFGQQVFVDTESLVYADLLQLNFTRQTRNDTNDLVIEEVVDFVQERLTLDAYFHKLRTQEPMSAEQMKLYAVLGDVNSAYALKYMTTFLLKFARKERVLQRRPDIFVEALVILGYIAPLDESSYRLNMELDKEHLMFRAH